MTVVSIDEELLIARAAGRLSAPMTLLVDSHAAMNDGIAAALHDAELASVALFEDEAGETMSDDAVDIAMAMIDALENGSGEAAGLKSVSRPAAASAAGLALDELMDLPAPVRDMALEAGAQWRFAAPGVRRIELVSEGNAKAELLRIEPGHGSPSHTHDGQEFTLVLTGAFADGIGRYGKGDLCAAGPETTHRPIAEPGEICIALAVTDGSLKFTGALGAVQRMLGG
ncbi:ChrR family anti-sigma-E factor [Hyphobacterium sp. HN65]|uniref:ChrR family anti-sigma-E factor n=1 Tax=Hyphobacterium lacteum TaxID=3116575 RepID=A0ABU7LSK8_9PROT|nr:ChrR family anti-sigma-E factor [Hyphobacterium sp. HN65]MEE2526569.1 ChrR family anti-sigma-E factor [Hyphobacterium sp. HN65]